MDCDQLRLGSTQPNWDRCWSLGVRMERHGPRDTASDGAGISSDWDQTQPISDRVPVVGAREKGKTLVPETPPHQKIIFGLGLVSPQPRTAVMLLYGVSKGHVMNLFLESLLMTLGRQSSAAV
jgi:hypothetical protein